MYVCIVHFRRKNVEPGIGQIGGGRRGEQRGRLAGSRGLRYNPGMKSAWRDGRKYLLLLTLMLLTGGCSSLLRQERPRVPLELDFAQVLPEGWEPIRSWTEVNIDGDDAVEYLLLFRYDAGQIGAAIYDSQIASDVVGVVDVSATPAPSATVAMAPVALQPFGYYKPYRLLPSYWAYTFGGGMGQGFVAPPGQEASVVPVVVTSNGGNGPPVELVLRGGTTHLTFVWWKNLSEGYGVTQLYAAGGFEGVNWDTWGASPKPIVEIAGLTPLDDYRARSQICRETRYTRRTPADADQARDPSGEPQAGIVFDAADEGLRFCQDAIPPHPFYPEGVALAYLTAVTGDRAGLDLLVTPGVAAGQVDADANVGRLANERIDDIATYATVQVTPGSVQNGEFAPTTSVCAELVETPKATDADASKVSLSAPTVRRWVVFTLRYQPPDLERRLPDRWTISGAHTEPSPVTPPTGSYCTTILGRGAP